MLLELLLPPIDRTVDRVAVVRWHKAEGDTIQYGDPLLDVQVRSIKRMKRDHEPNRILARLRGRAAGEEPEFWSMDVDILVRITSADFGTLREIHAAVGDVTEPGGLLAVCAAEGADTLVDADAATAELRITTSFLESA